VTERDWTQAETAKTLGIEQPHVSEHSRGLLDHFSVERLLHFLGQLEHQVTITVRHNKSAVEKSSCQNQKLRRQLVQGLEADEV
jgi:predicted transcriptional regulator